MFTVDFPDPEWTQGEPSPVNVSLPSTARARSLKIHVIATGAFLDYELIKGLVVSNPFLSTWRRMITRFEHYL